MRRHNQYALDASLQGVKIEPIGLDENKPADIDLTDQQKAAMDSALAEAKLRKQSEMAARDGQ